MFTTRQTYLNLIKLHTYLSKLEAVLSKTGEIDEKMISNIVGRLQKLNMYSPISILLILDNIPIDLLLMDENYVLRSRRNLLYFIKALRISIEKILLKMGRRIPIKDERPRKSYRLELYFSLKDLYPGYTFIAGRRPVLITATHAEPPLEDPMTKDIAMEVAKKAGAYLLISNISRILIDYNRRMARLTPFRRLIGILTLWEKKIKLILDLHSTRKLDHHDIEIGIMGGLSATPYLVRTLKETLERYKLRVSLERRGYFGGDITTYNALVPWVNILQLEVKGALKSKRKDRLIRALANYINNLKL